MNRFLAKGFAGVSVVNFAIPHFVSKAEESDWDRYLKVVEEEKDIDRTILRCLDDFIALGSAFSEENKRKVETSLDELYSKYKNYGEAHLRVDDVGYHWETVLALLAKGEKVTQVYSYNYFPGKVSTELDEIFDCRIKDLWWLNGKIAYVSVFKTGDFIKTRDQEKAANFINGLLSKKHF